MHQRCPKIHPNDLLCVFSLGIFLPKCPGRSQTLLLQISISDFLFCRYRTRAGWKAHEAYVHTKQLDYHCDEKGCGKAFYSEQCLIIHKRKHSGELPYICSHCGNRYISAHTLAQHEKAKHLETEVSFMLNFLFRSIQRIFDCRTWNVRFATSECANGI